MREVRDSFIQNYLNNLLLILNFFCVYSDVPLVSFSPLSFLWRLFFLSASSSLHLHRHLSLSSLLSLSEAVQSPVPVVLEDSKKNVTPPPPFACIDQSIGRWGAMRCVSALSHLLQCEPLSGLGACVEQAVPWGGQWRDGPPTHWGPPGCANRTQTKAQWCLEKKKRDPLCASGSRDRHLAHIRGVLPIGPHP